jgi:hypothetical protein
MTWVSMRLVRVVALAACALAGCSADSLNDLDGKGLVVEILSGQPESPDLGVLVAVHARGGESLLLSIDHGSFVSLTGGPVDAGAPEAPVSSRCFANPGVGDTFSVHLAVRPDQGEALLYAVLYEDSGCTGTTVQDRVVAVRRPGENPPVDAGVDAGGTDAR